MAAPGTGTGKRVAHGQVACYLRFGVPDAGSVSPAQCSWKRTGWAGVAQPVEHLICNQRVGGSNPFASSKSFVSKRRRMRDEIKIPVRFSFQRSALPKDLPDRLNAESLPREAKRGWLNRCQVGRGKGFRGGLKRSSRSLKVCAELTCAAAPSRHDFYAQVGERLKPTDCKSVGLRSTEVRILPCAPFFGPVGARLAGCNV